ncbi:MAG: transporter [Bacteroidales bacterium]|nr:transporter [Bacteroidales bacterium]
MSSYKYTFKKFIKDWMLIIGMLAGAGIYLIYNSLDFLHPAGPYLETAVRIIQPLLLFAMLFLSFCKIEPTQMRPHKWHLWLLFFQGGWYIALSLLILWAMHSDGNLARLILAQRIPIEAAILCLICPTATACAVVTGKLGGNMAGVVTYTIIINLLVSILVPVFVPLIYPMGGLSFSTAICKILAKVFPLLILPCLCAWMVRYLFPILHSKLLQYSDLSFYIWAVSLTLALLMSTRAIVHNEGAASVLLGIAIASLLSCLMQFLCGRLIGSLYGCRISAGQALGQKNTVFAIWMGYTFFDPIVSVAGGFYSIWHNCFNTWQLYRRRKEQESLRTRDAIIEKD